MAALDDGVRPRASISGWQALWRTVYWTRKYWPSFARSSAAGAAASVIALAAPYLAKTFIDVGLPQHDATFTQLLAVSILVVNLSAACMRGVRSIAASVVSAQVSQAASAELCRSVLHLPLQFFEERRSGEVTSRFGDLQSALAAVGQLFEAAIGNGVALLGVPLALAALDWRLTAIALMTVPISALVAAAGGGWLRARAQRMAELGAQLQGALVEAIGQVKLIQAMQAERRVVARLNEQFGQARVAQVQNAAVVALVGLLNAAVGFVGQSVITYVAWTLMQAHELTLGDYVAFSGYVGLLTVPVAHVVGLWTSLQQSTVASARIWDVLDRASEARVGEANQDALTLAGTDHALLIEDLRFGYRPDAVVLDGVSFKVAAGESCAIVGASGAGKSTLVRLIGGFGRPLSGRIALGNVRVGVENVAVVRALVTIVWQDSTLLRGSLRDNLTLGVKRPDAVSDQALWDAVAACDLQGVVSRLRGGLESDISELGASLSGGERQRVAIARGLLRGSPFLVLDEATSALDAVTEQRVLDGVFSRGGSATRIFVTHRRSVAKRCDKVIVLKDGRVVAEGSDEYVSSRCQYYLRTVSSESSASSES